MGSELEERYSAFINSPNESTNLFRLNQMAGQSGTSKTQPWSGSYWPLGKGSVASPKKQWNDFLWTRKGIIKYKRDFERRMTHISNHIDQLTQKELEALAPTEKYDLYLGDSQFTLSRAIWDSSIESFQRLNKIERWEGSCQGWASASIYSNRPRHFFNVLSLDGKFLIPFFPDDIKALETLLWSNSNIQEASTLEGSRCWKRKPEIDRANGHVLDSFCNGVNPGLFHLAVLKLIGVEKTAFIINRTNTRQVWNQPIFGYSLSYFNVKNLKKGELETSLTSTQEYSEDPFLQYRNAQTRNLVGVQIRLDYTKETRPTHKTYNNESNDKIRHLTFNYDLELNEKNEVIGGEWLTLNEELTENSENEDEGEEEPDQNPGNFESANPLVSNKPKFPGFMWRFKYNQPYAFSVFDPVAGTEIQKIPQTELRMLSEKAAHYQYHHYQFDEIGAAHFDHDELKPQALSIVVNELTKMSQ